MKKIRIFYTIIGFAGGIAIGHIFNIIGSYLFGSGLFYTVSPKIIAKYGSELNAVVVQTILTGLIGVVFSQSSLIYEKEEWSLLKQTVIHFFVTCSTMTTVSIILDWTNGNEVTFVVIFAFIYLVIWFSQYLLIKKETVKLNEKIKN